MATFNDDDFYTSNPFPWPSTRNEVNGTIATASSAGDDNYTASNSANVPILNAPTMTIVGTLDIKSDHDFYRIQMNQEDTGATFTFDVDGTTDGLDAYISIFDANGVLVASNDDGGLLDAGSTTGFDPYLTYTPDQASYFYVEVRSFNSASTGDYALHVGLSNLFGIQSYGNGSMAGDQLFGDAQGDVINDLIEGRAGDDVIYGDYGEDTLVGGDGIDFVYGGEANDILYGDDRGSAWVGLTAINGGLYEGPGDEDTVYGGNGNDNIYGGRGGDKLFGEGGDDRMDGGDGDDRFDGGPGADTYLRESPYTAGVDTFVLRKLESSPTAFDIFDYGGGAKYASFNGAGVAGGDIIEFAGLAPVFWHGAVAFNTALGSAVPGGGNGVNDGLYFNASAAATWLFVDADDTGTVSANDLLAKFDTSAVSFAISSLILDDFKAKQVFAPEQGLASDEAFTGLATTDYIKGGGGKDTMNGNAGIDLLMGESGNDKLNGGDGNDSLDGGTENDLLIGGAGRDTMRGGADKDRFDFNAIADSGITINTRDAIADFVHGQDKIDLATIDANPGGGAANDAFAFLATGGFTAAGQVRVLAVNGGLDALVRVNTDADTAPEATILLVGTKAGTITATDFIL